MKPFSLLFAAALCAATAIPSAMANDKIGVRDMTVSAPERGSEITATVWYPAGAEGVPVLVGDNAVFKGTPAHRDAPVAQGPFPVILLSHGGLRAAPNQDSWIASQLAAQGFVVAVPHPPGPMQLKALDAPREMWLRPADLSATLTALERDPVLFGKIDPQKIGVLGFRLGGTSALALSGAQLDAGMYSKSCNTAGINPDCDWFKKKRVDLHKVSAKMLERSNLDPRVKSVVVVDPELAEVFTPASLSGISVPAQVISLGRGNRVASGQESAFLSKHMPLAHHEMIPHAIQFDAFSECKPKGAAILQEEEGDGSLCTAGPQSRTTVHALLTGMITGTFKRQFIGVKSAGKK